MKIDHDQWSALGEANLGGADSANTRFMRLGQLMVIDEGAFILQKCILNDYWADSMDKGSWSREKIDIVMSKLYYCWVAMMQPQMPLGEEE